MSPQIQRLADEALTLQLSAGRVSRANPRWVYLTTMAYAKANQALYWMRRS